MPAVIPLIVGIATAATGAASLGYSIANQPGAPAAPSGPTQAQSVDAETQRRQAAAKQAQQQLPGLQSATSGSVSPGYLQQMSALLSGNSDLGGSPQLLQAVQSFLGQGQPGGIPSATTTPGLNSSSAGIDSLVSPQGIAGSSGGLQQQQDNNPFNFPTFG